MSSSNKLLFKYGISTWPSRWKESRFANERYHANIQNDGTFSVIPQMRGGVTDADQLIRLGEVAKNTMYH